MSCDVLAISRLFSSHIYKAARFFLFRDSEILRVVDQSKVKIKVL